MSKSTSDGSTWSNPIPAGKGDIGATWGSGLAHGIALRSGRLAAAYRTDCADRGQPGYHCTDNFFISDRALLSDDQGTAIDSYCIEMLTELCPRCCTFYH